MVNENLIPFLELGRRLRQEAFRKETFQQLLPILYRENYWFTPFFVNIAIENIANALDETKLQAFAFSSCQPYPRKNVAVISSGIAPLENFIDLFHVIVSGNNYQGKLGTKDKRLLPFLVEQLLDIEPLWRNRISFTERISHFDAFIADKQSCPVGTFQHYLQNIPHRIRENRTSVAVLTGQEDEHQLRALANDIYLYFGQGTRSVSKLWVPRDYDFVPLLQMLHEQSLPISDHNQYLNHLDYQKSIRLMNKLFYMDAGTFLLLEESALRPSTSIVNYEYYDQIDIVVASLHQQERSIQHIMSNTNLSGLQTLPFGTSNQQLFINKNESSSIQDFLSNLT